jgi:hypothetical protein
MGVSEWVQNELRTYQDSDETKTKKGVHRDFMVRRIIAESCLDKISNGFQEMKLQIQSKDILVLAVSMARRSSGLEENRSTCINEEKKSQDKRGIIRFTELGEQNLAYLFAEAIVEIGAKNITNFSEVISLWEKWADEGLQILYCDFFSKDFNSSPRLFFERLLE